MNIGKPKFQFYFAHEPHLATYENRTRLAWMLKGYRRNKHNYVVKRAGLHSYIIYLKRTNLIACIAI